MNLQKKLILIQMQTNIM